VCVWGGLDDTWPDVITSPASPAHLSPVILPCCFSVGALQVPVRSLSYPQPDLIAGMFAQQ
jgi:hypothetical protein